MATEQQDFAALLKRAFPEFAGYHLQAWARVTKVYSGSGTHRSKEPQAAVDLEILDHEKLKVTTLPIFQQVELISPSPGIIAPPQLGQVVLVGFVAGLASGATVMGYPYETQQINVEENKLKLSWDQIQLGGGEDQMVLASKLIESISNIIDAVDTALGAGTTTGGSINGAATFSGQVGALKSDLENIKSQITLGASSKE